MSRFFSKKFSALTPYVPGEQPQIRNIIKLNTNESPFPPSPLAQKLAADAAKYLQLYSDPELKALKTKASEVFGVSEDELLFTNGSDEILDFAFSAFCDEDAPAVFPDVTYGFYPVFAEKNRVPYRTVALKDDFTIDINDYVPANGTVFIANPNAPTGIALSLNQIETLVSSNPDNIVVIDEAYVDFGGESAVPLIRKYDNLIITGTFSKSRSLAGARLGYAAACPALINDLNTVKYSTNPYNVNSMTAAAGLGALTDTENFKKCTSEIIRVREFTVNELKKLGFTVLPSSANFVFAASPDIDGGLLFTELKKRNIIVRHFTLQRIRNFNRISIGTEDQMQKLLSAIKEILNENRNNTEDEKK